MTAQDHHVSRRTLIKAGMAASLFIFSQGHVSAASQPSAPTDEDGYKAWLRYALIDQPDLLERYRTLVKTVYVPGQSATARAVEEELTTGLSAMLGCTVKASETPGPGSIVVINSQDGTSSLLLTPALSSLPLPGRDGYLLRSARVSGQPVILIVAGSDVGTMYGAFHLLRLIQTGQSLHAHDLDIQNEPKNPLRILAHGDDLDGSIERGYAGHSLWNWQDLPGKVNPRLKDYARLNASIGINGVVLNRVNASPTILNANNLVRMASLADVFRPYGLRLYVTANFASPKTLGGLPTADPLDPAVSKWWHNKVAEIDKLIPDFGGFLIKADSEDLPGPHDYGRTHAQGANALAAALAPYGGIIMWRAFVYTVGNQNEDRVKRAYIEFKPLDGQFADNVLLQVKNGPLDFQPREPFHPLFGAMRKTRLLAELEITQEYLGQSTHLVYLGSEWSEFFKSNTYVGGSNSKVTVADVVEASPFKGSGGLVATANTGSDRNWCGHHFAQANWFAYGRLAWDPQADPAYIASEWTKATWSIQPAVVATIEKIVGMSYEAYVSYTMPLGLHHMVGGDHYAPLPEGEGDPRGIYHHADTDGIGYDRTRLVNGKGGSDAVDEYNAPLNAIFNDSGRCPEKLLLWFHHLPWDHRMSSGRTLWQELCFKYESGVDSAREMEKLWLSLAGRIDNERHREVALKLETQAKDARKWADHCLSFFSQFSKMPRS
jgi:alpha-glucuronidase